MDSKFILESDWINEYYKTSTLKLPPLYYNNNNNNNKFEKPYENFDTNKQSPTFRFGYIDPDGILKGS